jgi:uncharacterized protein YdaT
MSEELDVITPLQAYAYEAHEMYHAFINAGFSEGEAWDLLTRQFPDWEFPAAMSDNDMDDLEEEEEDVNEK